MHHVEPLNYCNSQDFGDLRWCRISSINSILQARNPQFCGVLIWCRTSSIKCRDPIAPLQQQMEDPGFISYCTHKVRANESLLFGGNALVLCFCESLELRVVVHTGQSPSLYTFNPEPANPEPYLLF